jgi:hypothetical protein
MADAKKLSSLDASCLYLETPEMPMHVGSMAIFRLPEITRQLLFEDFGDARPRGCTSRRS